MTWKTAIDETFGIFCYSVAEGEGRERPYARIMPGPLTPAANGIPAHPAANHFSMLSDDQEARPAFTVNRKAYLEGFRIERPNYAPDTFTASSPYYAERWTQSAADKFYAFAEHWGPRLITPLAVAEAVHATARRRAEDAQEEVEKAILNRRAALDAVSRAFHVIEELKNGN